MALGGQTSAGGICPVGKGRAGPPGLEEGVRGWRASGGAGAGDPPRPTRRESCWLFGECGRG